ncbi:hypothetical protein Salat_2999200 [Sesamum alatum]|uniref:Uncharacterized protein n=1 Tax=Sesamum alatum TaxID=300844 RepID=A0AAE1XHB6_9LAMI|nr:hypothetical protein Salat_2999200 [Sesamum alatum]
MELCHKAEGTHLKIKGKLALAALFEREYALLDADDGVRRDSFKPRVWTVEKERAPSLEEFDHQRGFFNYSLKPQLHPPGRMELYSYFLSSRVAEFGEQIRITRVYKVE